MDVNGGASILQLAHDRRYAFGADRARPILHDVPLRQIQERSYAAGDAAEEIADPARPLSLPRARIAESREQLGSLLLANLRQPFGRVELRAVDDGEHERDE